MVIYHGACPDGSASALAASLKLGDDATYLAAHYGQEPPPDETLRGRKVYLLDFCYDPPVMERLLEIADVQVLDHHRTHAAAFADRAGDRRFVFDLDHSGAVLAFKHFFPGEVVPELFLYVEDRDLWRFRLPDSRAITAALRASGGHRRFARLRPLLDQWGPELKARLVREGVALLKLQEQLVDSMVAKAELVELDGVKALAANATVLFSEVAESLYERHPPMGIAFFWDGTRNRFQVSLRSRDGFDVSAIALRRGGGGHTQAAAFLCSELPWRKLDER